jgi:DNA-binding response OmpR family regulator/class 3 adenylate cyclase/predicted ATPase
MGAGYRPGCETAMRSRVLVVGRDVALRAHLARLLSAAGYAVDIAEDAAHVHRISLNGTALAVVAPAGLGAELGRLLNTLRTVTGRRVLIVGSAHSPNNRPDVTDVVDEPGLLAQVSDALATGTKEDDPAALLQFADYTLDLGGQTLIDQAGREVALTHGEYRLLQEFVQRPGRVLSRDRLLKALSGRGAEVYDRSIDMMVVRLRRKIEPDPKRPSLIVAVPGRGYKFAAGVQAAEVTAKATAAPIESPPAPPERRQITALSVELVPGDSHRLPQDPEELQPLIDAYRRQAAEIVAQHRGIIAHCVAREVFAYFGHPIAQEDAAEQAILAALALAECPTGGAGEIVAGLVCRVGIATGLVVVDPAGEIIGDAPSDAARMRSLAEPGQVVVAASTRHLGGRLFAYRAVAPGAQSSVASPAAAWQVLGVSALASRSEALYDSRLTPLVGREEERDLLVHAWQRAKSGEGRVVLLSGEPGIGKSRLLVELEERLATETHSSLRYFCSPLHRGRALHPIAARWRQAAGMARGDTAAQRLGKLEAVLAPDELSPADVALLADMLGIMADDQYPQPDLGPQPRKERTFAILLGRLVRLAQEQPVLLLFEDAHWADDSSLELIDRLISQITELPVLLCISFRSEFVPPWIGRPGVSLVTLTRLDRQQSATLAAQVAAKELTRAVLQYIMAKADGVPLFIEELTKAVLEAASQDSSPALAVPATLQASLMARLDRLTTAKQVAQIGAVIGREFPHTLLTAAAQLPEPLLTQGIGELVAAGLLFRRGLPPDATYTFKHALVQEIAYESLLRARRQHIHRQIAEIVRDQMPEWAGEEPEIVAHHFTKAALPAPAVEWWGRAGEQASRRYAYTDAIAYLEQALQLADQLEEDPGQRRKRLRLQVAYANALRISRGFGMPETQAAFAAARDLAAGIEDVSERFPAYYGLWSAGFLRGDLAPLQETSAAFLRDVASMPELAETAIAQRICGMTRWFEGNFIRAQEHLQHALAIHDAARDRELAYRFGQDGACPTRGYLAQTLWALGLLDRATDFAGDMVVHALETRHIPTIAYAYAHAGFFEMVRQDRLLAAPHAEALLGLARKHGMPVWTAIGTFLEGWLRWGTTDRAASTAEMHEGLALMGAQHLQCYMPLMTTRLAETEAEAGCPDAALARVNMQLATVEQSGQRWFLSGLHRARGELLLQCPPHDVAAAESAFLRAIDVARSQAAKLYELQAAMSLGRLWIGEGQHARAHDLIAPICAWFGAGPDCTTLTEARALLNSLALA